ncbi:hypothetical protein SAMN04488134_10357 [Amphibacillus marinus]|uniref:Uncharacterized protein n=1 Tax=Amphibacillus marinus TaxID=872970 RepID=A0A1H8L2A0_9BACI|nr:hypothetical protein [Amphibacillus marinus]SEN99320.1 hypothetical protein SAMN04488134_10357 [Amphibacillus marinus]
MTNKRKFSLGLFVLCLVTIYLSTQKSVEEVLHDYHNDPINILHEDDQNGYAFVLYEQTNEQEYLLSAVLERSLFGYRVLSNGVAQKAEQLGYTSFYYPDAIGLKESVLFGVIHEDGIKK